MTDIPSNLDDLDGNEVDMLPPPSNPMAVARELVTGYQSGDQLTLRRWRGSWMQWKRTCWAEAEDAVVRSWLYQRLEHAQFMDTSGKVPVPRDWEPNRRKITDVEDALNAIIHLAEDTDPPAWLGGSRPAPANEIVSCGNGLLHVGTRKLYQHTPRYFGTVAVPFDYDPAAPAPELWLKFLSELWPDDQDSVDALQEFFGYVLSGRTDLHKIMLLIGPARSGKGTIARILTAMIGTGNAAGPTLSSLGTNFGLSPLLGKPLAIISDARLGRGDEHQVVERLLSISGEDMLTVDRKYRDPWTGKLPSRFLVLSNELPRFGDASGAIANRFIVLVMTESFLGRENHKLTAQLLPELPGILSWSLDGLDRLARNGTLTSPQSSTDAIVALHDLVSPTSAFVRDKCVRGGDIAVATLFAAWKEWAELNGHRAGNSATFGRNLRAVVPVLGMSQPRDGDARERRYVGITLRTAHNGAERVPPRATTPGNDPERDGTRSNPLWAHPATCPVCGKPMDPALAAAGVTTHPSCADHPDDPAPGSQPWHGWPAGSVGAEVNDGPRHRTGRPPLPEHKREEIRSLRARGLTIRQVAEQAHVGVGTVHKVIGESQ
jgi:putative DNA primase/helicase